MRARVAYISSLGTTAILVAAALLMLAVVSAIVAFRGWPGAANAAAVQAVPLTPSFERASATVVAARVHLPGSVVRTRPIAARQPAGRLSTAGLVKVVGPGASSGVVKFSTGPGLSLHASSPAPSRPIPTFPPPSGGNPVTISLPSGSSGSGSGSLLHLPDSAATAPVTHQVSGVVNQVTSSVPSPPAAVETVRSALPIP